MAFSSESVEYSVSAVYSDACRNEAQDSVPKASVGPDPVPMSLPANRLAPVRNLPPVRGWKGMRAGRLETALISVRAWMRFQSVPESSANSSSCGRRYSCCEAMAWETLAIAIRDTPQDL